jgi:hypothetical protein
MQLSIVRNLILVEFSDWFATSGSLVIDAVGWQSMYFVVMPRVNLIVIFLTYHVYLYFINCPTVICLPSMCYLSSGETPLVNCGPRSYFHHIAITCLLYLHYLLYLHCLLYSHTFTVFHSIRSYPLFQANRWDWQPHRNLGTKYLVVLCAGSTLLLAKQSLDEAPYKLSGAVVKLASITFSRLSVLLLIDKPWFLTEGKACCCAHHTFRLGFPNWLVIIIINYTLAIKPFSGAVAGEEKEDLYKGSFSHAHPLLCYLFCFTLFIFTCIVLSKNQKKLVYFIVAFIYLL